jgi:hypothetical protein
MAQIALVEKQIVDGQKFVEQLAQSGFEVTGAGWVQTWDDSQWYLYIASPIVDARGRLKAYHAALIVLDQMPQPFGVEFVEFKLIETTHPIAQAIQEMYQRNPRMTPYRSTGGRLGEVTIEGAYIYPPLSAPEPEASSGSRRRR